MFCFCFFESFLLLPVGAPRLHARRKEEERLAEKRTPLPKPPPIKSDKEKEDLRRKMRNKYEVKFDIPERILYMALESVLYDEEQANNLMYVCTHTSQMQDLLNLGCAQIHGIHHLRLPESSSSKNGVDYNLDN